MLKSLYHWMLHKARHRHARYWLAVISGMESVFFPIPPDIMLLPMALANRKKALLFATYCTLGSLIGAVVGYGIGYVFFDSLGQHIITMYNKADAFAQIQLWLKQYDWLVVAAAAFTPIPFKIATVTSGFAGLNFFTFILAATLGRGMRYFLIAGLVLLFGTKIEYLMENYFGWIMTLGFCVFLLGWLVLI